MRWVSRLINPARLTSSPTRRKVIRPAPLTLKLMIVGPPTGEPRICIAMVRRGKLKNCNGMAQAESGSLTDPRLRWKDFSGKLRIVDEPGLRTADDLI